MGLNGWEAGFELVFNGDDKKMIWGYSVIITYANVDNEYPLELSLVIEEFDNDFECTGRAYNSQFSMGTSIDCIREYLKFNVNNLKDSHDKEK